MPRKRPAVLTVMGILNIVLGSLFLLCNLCSGIGLVFMFSGATANAAAANAGAAKGKDNPFAELGQLNELMEFCRTQVPGFAAVRVSEIIVGLVASVILVIGGIGLLKVQKWGRILSLLYSVLAILLTLGSLVYTFALVNPAVERFWQARGAGVRQNDNVLTSILTVLFAGIGVAYALVLLIMMLLPSVSAAFAAQGRPDSYDLDRQEEEDEYLDRERRFRQEEPE